MQHRREWCHVSGRWQLFQIALTHTIAQSSEDEQRCRDFQQTIRGAGGYFCWHNGSSRHVGDKKRTMGSRARQTFLADMVKKTNCNEEIPYIFQRARSLSLKIAMSEIQNEFKDCQKSKALGDTSSSDESSKDQESIEPIPPKSLDPEVIFVDRFKNPGTNKTGLNLSEECQPYT